MLPAEHMRFSAVFCGPAERSCCAAMGSTEAEGEQPGSQHILNELQPLQQDPVAPLGPATSLHYSHCRTNWTFRGTPSLPPFNSVLLQSAPGAEALHREAPPGTWWVPMSISLLSLPATFSCPPKNQETLPWRRSQSWTEWKGVIQVSRLLPSAPQKASPCSTDILYKPWWSLGPGKATASGM